MENITLPRRALARLALKLMLAAAALTPGSSLAVWDYSIGAQVAMLDSLIAYCGKVEKGMAGAVQKELAPALKFYGEKAVAASRHSADYRDATRAYWHSFYGKTWGDPELIIQTCAGIYASTVHQADRTGNWWQDRPCAGIHVGMQEPKRATAHCTKGPLAEVFLVDAHPDKHISLLRLVPSSDIGFPGANARIENSYPGQRFIPNLAYSTLWSLPESLRVEWKEWPDSFPPVPENDKAMAELKAHVQRILSNTPRRNEQVALLARIPPEVLADADTPERSRARAQASARNLRVFLVFMPEGIKLRWEQWKGECVARIGGDPIDQPPKQLSSGSWFCADPKPKPCPQSGESLACSK